MSEQDTYVEELKTDVITLINQRAKLRETVEKQKLVIDELNENYLKLNAKFDASEAKVEAANKILENLAKEAHPKNYVLAYQHLQHVLKIPRKEVPDKNIMPEPLYELKKQSPIKCQDCECIEANFKNGGWVWECETAPKCYKETAVLDCENKDHK